MSTKYRVIKELNIYNSIGFKTKIIIKKGQIWSKHYKDKDATVLWRYPVTISLDPKTLNEYFKEIT